MKPDQERVKTLLSQTVTLLCKNGLHFEKELRIQGLLGITIDYDSVFIVHFDESLSDFGLESTTSLSTEVTPKESFKTKDENSKSTVIVTGNTADFSCLDSEARNFSSHLEVVAKSSPALVLSGETNSSQEDDIKLVKTEAISEEDGDDDVVLVESENEYSGEVTGSLFTTTDDNSTRSQAKQDRSHRMYLQPPGHSHKRRRLALPSAIENICMQSDVRNYSVKMEPVTSEYMDSNDQNFSYEENFPRKSWDNNKSPFSHDDHDVGEELSSVPGCSSWEEFDLQARVMPSTNLMAKNNELYHESASSNAMLPLSNITNVQMRQALTQHVVIPLIYEFQFHISAFRVIWRSSTRNELEAAWNQVGLHRLTFDDMISSLSDIEFFFSAVTGLYNKTKRKMDPRSCSIYPAISYYVVSKSDRYNDIMSNIRKRVYKNFKETEVKSISRHSLGFGTRLPDLTAPLFVALKDYNSSYVRKKLDDGFVLMGCGMKYMVVKLVVVNPALNETVLKAYEDLKKDIPNLRSSIDLVLA